ncbi:MAG: hypothetical protein JO260_01920 [Acidobacteria bacterium]|nr:hypothetical protein [Acidobacteriota bacterium]
MVTTKGLSTMRARERRKVRVPQAVFVLLVFLGFLQARNFAIAMSGVMATHFGASGAANGWQSKEQFFLVEIVLLCVCLLIGFGIPAIIAAAPPSLVNLPNKEFWLAPVRRDHTLAVFRIQMAWFACALLTFLIVVNQLVFNANQSVPRHLNGSQFTIALVAFLGFVAIWTIRLISYFSKVPA